MFFLGDFAIISSMHSETLLFHCINNASSRPFLLLHDLIHLTIPSRIFFFAEMKSIFGTLAYQLPQVFTFYDMQITSYNMFMIFIHERRSSTMTWESIWVCKKRIDVNTRKKEVEIEYFRANRIPYYS